MSQQTISVLVTVRDEERFLAQALDSVFAQTRPPDQVIVIDDGSKDGSKAIVQSYEPRLSIIELSGEGAPTARNVGLERATGTLIAFLDSDDVWEPTKLEKQADVLNKQQDAGFSVSHIRHFLEPGYPPPPGFNTTLFEKDVPAYLPSTLLARRELFQSVGLFDEKLLTGDDVDWFARAKDAGVIGVVHPDTLMRKRVHDRNISNDAESNTPRLLALLRESIQRQREAQSQGE